MVFLYDPDRSDCLEGPSWSPDDMIDIFIERAAIPNMLREFSDSSFGTARPLRIWGCTFSRVRLGWVRVRARL